MPAVSSYTWTVIWSPLRPITSPTRRSAPTSTSSSMPTFFEPRARTTGPLIQVIVPTSLLMPFLPSTFYTLRSAGLAVSDLGGFRECCHNATYHLTHSLQCPYLPQACRPMKIFHLAPWKFHPASRPFV